MVRDVGGDGWSGACGCLVVDQSWGDPVGGRAGEGWDLLCLVVGVELSRGDPHREGIRWGARHRR
jgi:hypothetical protein